MVKKVKIRKKKKKIKGINQCIGSVCIENDKILFFKNKQNERKMKKNQTCLSSFLCQQLNAQIIEKLKTMEQKKICTILNR
ncbi:hypothetical protein YYG_01324 [Plasmodium vinckei petteri]|uniref:Uncharacterized protein n=1 Tax=Plasmodium vinckei petteri TaxID=138298 RepID=W7AIL6_PLAVN|nr:hypothetical protein YYG_01324 [Plasmodium vinckei petteri]